MNRKGYKIIKSIKSMILERIKEHPPGWAFSAYDFIFEFDRGETDESLSYLAKEGKIRRVIRGIYDYPAYSELLQMNVAPDIDQVAKALARKFNLKIYPNGDTALNYFGLSTQVPAKDIYFTDGPSRKYHIGNKCIEFKHISQKETSLMYPKTALVIQAIKAVGKNQITLEFLLMLKKKFTFSEWTQIKDDASNSTGWVYKIIKEISNNP